MSNKNTENKADIIDYSDINPDELNQLLELTTIFADTICTEIEVTPEKQAAFYDALYPDNGREPTDLAATYLAAHQKDYFGFERALDAADAEINPALSQELRTKAIIDHLKTEDLLIGLVQGETISGNAKDPCILSSAFLNVAVPKALGSDENIALLRKINAHNIANVITPKV